MSYGRPPPDVEGMTSLKVDNLTYRTSPDTLRRVFEKYGRVGDVYIPRDRYTKESRGFAFVRFHDKRDAEDAMDAMDGAVCVLALEDAVAADLEAGAALDPAVGPATVGPNPDLAHGLGLAPPPSPGLPGDPSQSPRLSLDPGPGQDRGPDLEALPLPQRGNPTLDPGLRALPSLQKKKELYPPRNMMHQINENPHKGRPWGEMIA
ncbi:serine/arginine-rich splicing factor 2 [Columba livia]|uniref:Serine/arginine-rich splicing factor 2 n=1 Tax=Columba livia TaxID=8932 RepID=A0A2I0M769_COLLI|nr:serine/arginine-rich splicing factor 2 [Columba livia]